MGQFIGDRLACSRLSVVEDERKRGRARKKKGWRTFLFLVLSCCFSRLFLFSLESLEQAYRWEIEPLPDDTNIIGICKSPFVNFLITYYFHCNLLV